MRITSIGESGVERRMPLTRERVLHAAVELADREGVGAVSMRRLGQELGVEAMSLYTHVRNKEDLLDGMADAVVGEVQRRRQDLVAIEPRRTARPAFGFGLFPEVLATC